MPALYVYLLFRFIQEKDVKNLHCKGKINVICLSSFFSVGPNICFILCIYRYVIYLLKFISLLTQYLTLITLHLQDNSGNNPKIPDRGVTEGGCELQKFFRIYIQPEKCFVTEAEHVYLSKESQDRFDLLFLPGLSMP